MFKGLKEFDKDDRFPPNFGKSADDPYLQDEGTYITIYIY